MLVVIHPLTFLIPLTMQLGDIYGLSEAYCQRYVRSCPDLNSGTSRNQARLDAARR